MPKVQYEWCCEEWTVDRSDIVENHFNESAFDCFKESEALETFLIVLIRDVYRNDGQLLGRSYAYVESGKLPTEFDCGAIVPKRFTLELNKTIKKIEELSR